MFGKAIRDVRKRRGLTLAELGDACGVSHVTMSRYERGTRAPSMKMLRKISDVLGVTFDELKSLAQQIEVPLDAKAGQTTGHVTDGAGLDAWTTRVIADGPDDPNLKLLLFVLQNYIDKTSWVVSGTIPQIAASASLPVGMVEDLWEELLASPFVERVGSGEWVLRLVVPGEGAEG